MKKINLESIKRGYAGLTKDKGGTLYQCCIVSLKRQQHESGSVMKLSGDFDEEIELKWKQPYTDQLHRTYADQVEATEHAAECLAILIAFKVKGFTDIERSWRGTGFDYWLGDSTGILFQKKARLEVSGIFDGDEQSVSKRFIKKSRQTDVSDYTKLPAIISVTNFKAPHTQFGEKQ